MSDYRTRRTAWDVYWLYRIARRHRARRPERLATMPPRIPLGGQRMSADDKALRMFPVPLNLGDGPVKCYHCDDVGPRGTDHTCPCPFSDNDCQEHTALRMKIRNALNGPYFFDESVDRVMAVIADALAVLGQDQAAKEDEPGDARLLRAKIRAVASAYSNPPSYSFEVAQMVAELYAILHESPFKASVVAESVSSALPVPEEGEQ